MINASPLDAVPLNCIPTQRPDPPPLLPPRVKIPLVTAELIL